MVQLRQDLNPRTHAPETAALPLYHKEDLDGEPCTVRVYKVCLKSAPGMPSASRQPRLDLERPVERRLLLQERDRPDATGREAAGLQQGARRRLPRCVVSVARVQAGRGRAHMNITMHTHTTHPAASGRGKSPPFSDSIWHCLRFELVSSTVNPTLASTTLVWLRAYDTTVFAWLKFRAPRARAAPDGTGSSRAARSTYTNA